MSQAEKIAKLENQLAYLSTDAREQRAQLHLELANAYADMGEVTAPQLNLPRAIENYRSALEFLHQ